LPKIAQISSDDGRVAFSISEAALPKGVSVNDIRIENTNLPSLQGYNVFLAYEMKPEGITFSELGELRIFLDEIALGGFDVCDLLVAWIVNGEVKEKPPTNCDRNGMFLTADIGHFSIYAVVGDVRGQQQAADNQPDTPDGHRPGVPDGHPHAGFHRCGGNVVVREEGLVGNMQNQPLNLLETPDVLFPPSGKYFRSLEIEIGNNADGSIIHYTLDGSEPTGDSPVYIQKIKLASQGNTDFKARAFKDNVSSAVSEVHYEVEYMSIKDFSIGENHACAIDADGQLYCWGNPNQGRLGIEALQWNSPNVYVPTIVPDVTEVVSVAVGIYHTCVVNTDGALFCWGGNSYGQLGIGDRVSKKIPTPVGADNNWLKVDAADTHTCGLKKDTTLHCWGGNSVQNSYEPLGIGDGQQKLSPAQVGTVNEGIREGWIDLALHMQKTCGIRKKDAESREGFLYCWGKNYHGDLGVGDAQHRSTPTQVGNDSNWVDVSAGFAHACGVKSNGEVFCWGNNHYGQLGHEAENLVSVVPKKVENLESVSSITSGAYHNCAVTKDEHIYCWGYNVEGAVGTDKASIVRLPNKIEGEVLWKKVGSKSKTTCALDSEGGMSCWGDNRSGVTALGVGPEMSSPAPVKSGKNWREIAPSWFGHTCGIKNDGKLFCWGNNTYGAVGIGTQTIVATEPVEVKPGKTWYKLATGANHTCAIDDDCKLFCWGRNTFGQVGFKGDGEVIDRPQIVAQEKNWREIKAGGIHTCGITAANELFCWGSNLSGEIGDGTDVHAPNPVKIDLNDTLWRTVSTGYHQTCATTEKGGLFCWGYNQNGELGIGVRDADARRGRNTPQEIKLADGWARRFEGPWEVTAHGLSDTCGVKGGAIFCWGIGFSRSLLPEQVGEDTDWANVWSVSDMSYYAIKKNGKALYSISTFNSQVSVEEVKILPGLDWKKIVGKKHSCGITGSGSLYCWGGNEYGQLGRGFSSNVFIPTEVISPPRVQNP